MDSGRLIEVIDGRGNRGNNCKNLHQDFDQWPPNRMWSFNRGSTEIHTLHFFVHSQIFARVEGSLQDKSTRWWKGMVWTRFVKCTVLLMTSWVACNLHVLNVFACAGLALIPASWNMLQHNWQSQFSKQMFSMKAVILWHREGRGVQHDCWKWYWKTLNTV